MDEKLKRSPAFPGDDDAKTFDEWVTAKKDEGLDPAIVAGARAGVLRVGTQYHPANKTMTGAEFDASIQDSASAVTR